MDTHITRKPKPEQIRIDYLSTSSEIELVEVFRDLSEPGRLELLAFAMKMKRTDLSGLTRAESNEDLRGVGEPVSEVIDFPFPSHTGEILPIPRPVGGHLPKVVTDKHRNVEASIFRTILINLRNLCFGKRGR